MCSEVRLDDKGFAAGEGVDMEEEIAADPAFATGCSPPDPISKVRTVVAECLGAGGGIAKEELTCPLRTTAPDFITKLERSAIARTCGESLSTQ